MRYSARKTGRVDKNVSLPWLTPPPASWASLLSALEFPAGPAQFSRPLSFVPDKLRAGAALFAPDVADPYARSIGRMPVGRNAKSAPPLVNRIAILAATLVQSCFISAFPQRFSITSRQLIFASVVLLSFSAAFALLNLQKTRGLRTEVAQSQTSRVNAERRSASREQQLKERETAVAEGKREKTQTTNAKTKSNE